MAFTMKLMRPQPVKQHIMTLTGKKDRVLRPSASQVGLSDGEVTLAARCTHRMSACRLQRSAPAQSACLPCSWTASGHSEMWTPCAWTGPPPRYWPGARLPTSLWTLERSQLEHQLQPLVRVSLFGNHRGRPLLTATGQSEPFWKPQKQAATNSYWLE